MEEQQIYQHQARYHSVCNHYLQLNSVAELMNVTHLGGTLRDHLNIDIILVEHLKNLFDQIQHKEGFKMDQAIIPSR
jgi:hypothetical protein